MIPSKICKKCGVMQYILEFRENKNKYNHVCNDCVKIDNKIYRNKNNGKITQYRKDNKEILKLKQKTYYKRNKDKKQKYYQNNKETLKIKHQKYLEENNLNIKNQRKEYRLNNKEKIKQQKLKYALNNKDLVKTNNKKYYENNKEKLKISRKNYKRIRLKNNIELKIKANVSCSIYKNLLSNKSDKSSFKYLPYTIKELKLHLESLFEPWMNWNNWGVYNSKIWDDNNSSTWKWQIDHIAPHSTFNYDSMEHPEFKKCWALENLRPYSAKQNILDGANKIRHK